MKQQFLGPHSRRQAFENEVNAAAPPGAAERNGRQDGFRQRLIPFLFHS